jgi:hypothetical protein
LKLKYGQPLTNFAFNCNLRSYGVGVPEIADHILTAWAVGLICVARHVINRNLPPLFLSQMASYDEASIFICKVLVGGGDGGEEETG